MASPFSVFRKNQRLWMAAAVFVAICAFVVAPMLSSFQKPQGRNIEETLAASWNGGSITKTQLQREIYFVNVANTFLRKLATEVREKGGMPSVPEMSPDLSFVGITGDTNDPERIFERKILAAEAKRLGIVFDDQSVRTFLKKFCDGKISGDRIETILREVSNRQMTMFDFNKMMCEELAKNEMIRLAGSSLRFEERRESQTIARPVLTTPSKNWQDYQRFNRVAKIRAYPVYTKDFESKVTSTPTDRELRDLYNEGKDRSRIDAPLATQPAFMIPQTANFEYIICDLEKIVTEEMAKIPEDLLRSEYERRVKEKEFRVPVTPETPALPPATDPTAPATPAPTTPTETKVEGEPKPAGSESPAETTSPAPTEQPATPASTEPAATEPAQPAAEPQPPAAEPPKPESSSSNTLRKSNSDVRLVSFQEPTGTQEPAPPAAEPTVQPPTLEQPTAPETAPATPAAPAAESGLQITPPAVGETTAPPTTPADLAESTPMRTQTFEEVRERIARSQATGTAFKIIDERMSNIVAIMNTYSVELRAFEQSVNEKVKDAVMPKRPSLEELAKEAGFEYATTGMVNYQSAFEIPVGRSRVSRGQRMQAFEFRELILVEPNPAENDSLGNLFVPLTSFGVGQRFIFWKTESKPGSTPAFELVKDEVKDVWKKQRAAELAEAKAKEIASRVSGGNLVDILETAEEKALVLEPAPFTWLNQMFANIDGRLQLSNIELLQPTNNDFMEAVFGAAKGDTVVAPDAAKTVYYAVQVVEFSPEQAALFEKFAAAPTLNGVMTASNDAVGRSIPAWFSNLQKKLDFQRN